MSFLFIVKIDSIDVTRYCQPFEINESKDNNITTVSLSFVKLVENVVTLQQLKRIEIWRGEVTSTDEKVFDGFITNVRPDGLVYKVSGGDKLYRAVNAVVNQVYALTSPQAGVVSEIFLDLINTYTSLTATSATVQNSGTTNILEKFKVRRKSVYDAAKKLADAIGWQFYYRSDTDLVYFETKGSTLNTNTLTVGGNVISLPKWEEDNSEFFNDTYITGAPTAVAFTDTYTADGIEDTFSITRGVPISVEVLVNSVVKTGGVTTATSDAQYLVDAEAQAITFTTGNIPTAGQTVTINYTYNITLAVHAFRQSSITKYGETVTRPFTFSEIKTMADLQQRAEALLDVHTTPFLQATLRVGSQYTSALGMRSGQRIRVVDARNMIEGATINREFVIISRRMRFPSDYDEIVVGDKEWKTGDWEAGVEERLQKLVDEANESEEVLLELLSLTHILRLIRKQITIARYYINDSFIIDHDTNGVMYNSDETAILNNFETSADWAETAGLSVSITITNDSTANHFWIGSQGVNMAWTATSGSALMSNTTAQPDLTNVVGTATGTPVRGTAGVWCYTTTPLSMSAITLYLGNDISNYFGYVGQQFAFKVVGSDSSFGITNGLLVYVLFDLDTPATSDGTVNWAAIDLVIIGSNVTAAGNITFDYLTMSRNDTIALNGMGDRNTLRATTTTVY